MEIIQYLFSSQDCQQLPRLICFVPKATTSLNTLLPAEYYGISYISCTDFNLMSIYIFTDMDVDVCM